MQLNYDCDARAKDCSGTKDCSGLGVRTKFCKWVGGGLGAEG